jgi:hypothetical protein
MTHAEFSEGMQAGSLPQRSRQVMRALFKS